MLQDEGAFDSELGQSSIVFKYLNLWIACELRLLLMSYFYVLIKN